MSNPQTLAVTVDTSAVQAFVDQLRTAEPLKILATGEEVPATDSRTDHVAVRFPDTGWIVATTLTSDEGEEFADGDDVPAAVAKTDLLGRSDWVNAPLDDVLLRHVIRHDRFGPAVDTNLFPNFPKYSWIRSDIVPGDPARAFSVCLYYGNVYYYPRSYGGFGLPCCRARQ